MTRRAESADDTRDRILAAAFALHGEQGVVATSVKDIAARADVGVGTVYHHFPTYDDVVRACGARTAHNIPAPSAETIAKAKDKVRALVEEMFAFYDRIPGFELVRGDRARSPIIEQWMTEFDEQLLSLAALVTRSRRGAQVVAAILDVAVYRNLQCAGLSRRAAAAQISELIQAWLKGTKS